MYRGGKLTLPFLEIAELLILLGASLVTAWRTRSPGRE
jgi:hypothetical protein